MDPTLEMRWIQLFMYLCAATALVGLTILFICALRRNTSRAAGGGDEKGGWRIEGPAWLIAGISLVVIGIGGLAVGWNVMHTLTRAETRLLAIDRENKVRSATIAYELFAQAIETKKDYASYKHTAERMLTNLRFDPSAIIGMRPREIRLEPLAGKPVLVKPDTNVLKSHFDSKGVFDRTLFEEISKQSNQ